MTTLLFILALGFFLGMRHATDADHVIAVTTIVTRQRHVGQAAMTGLLWGVGHTVTILAVGIAIILFNVAISDRVGARMELSVGVMLIVLGVLNVRRYFALRPAIWRDAAGRTDDLQTRAAPQTASHAARRSDQHADPHTHQHADSQIDQHANLQASAHRHGDYIHSHPHGAAPAPHPHRPDQTPLATLDRTFGRRALYMHLRPLIVGIVHGLAGSAAVTLLVLATITDPLTAIAYLLLFGVGTIAGMILITMSIASVFSYAGAGSAVFSQRLGLASGLLSIAFGLWVAYEQSAAAGLLPSLLLVVPR